MKFGEISKQHSYTSGKTPQESIQYTLNCKEMSKKGHIASHGQWIFQFPSSDASKVLIPTGKSKTRIVQPYFFKAVKAWPQWHPLPRVTPAQFAKIQDILAMLAAPCHGKPAWMQSALYYIGGLPEQCKTCHTISFRQGDLVGNRDSPSGHSGPYIKKKLFAKPHFSLR